MTHRFGFIFVNSLFIPEGEPFQASMKSYASAFQQLGGRQVSPENLNDPEPLVYFMTTGGTEQVLLDIREQRRKFVQDEPVLVVAYPANNSLPASLEVLARLQQEGARGQVLYLTNSSDSTGLKKIQDVLTDHKIAAELKRARIGLLGTPSDWLVASSPAASVVKETWGPEVVPVSMDEINSLVKEVPADAIPAVRDPLVEGATEIQEVSLADIDNVVRVYLALKKVIDKYELDALTIRCFDLVLGLETTGCFGLSQLTDEGIIAGCEGDLVSTVGLMWAKKLTGQVPWMANPAQLDEVGNRIILAHCTVPRSMVRDYGLRSHFESNLGVGIQGTIANGPVTLLRIGGKKMEQLWLAEGDIIKSGKAEDLCRTQVEIKIRESQVSDLLKSPLGNHLVMVQGHHKQRLKSWWKTMVSHP